MSTNYTYELWNGTKVVGHYTSPYKLSGKFLTISELSTLKQPYNKKLSTNTFNLTFRLLPSDGISFTYRTVIDVRRKSVRQIKLLCEGYKL